MDNLERAREFLLRYFVDFEQDFNSRDEALATLLQQVRNEAIEEVAEDLEAAGVGKLYTNAIRSLKTQAHHDRTKN